MEVTVTGQITRSDHVTIETPKLLHLEKRNYIHKCGNINSAIMWIVEVANRSSFSKITSSNKPKQSCQSVWCSAHNSECWLVSLEFASSTRKCSCTEEGALQALEPPSIENKVVFVTTVNTGYYSGVKTKFNFTFFLVMFCSLSSSSSDFSFSMSFGEPCSWSWSPLSSSFKLD